MKVGFFGGCFDPIHSGHLLMASQSAEQLDLTQLFMVMSERPTDGKKPRASVWQRWNMLTSACAYQGEVLASDIEFKSGVHGNSFSTLVRLRNQLPKASLYLIVGMDQAVNFDRWYKSEAILQLCNVAILKRFHHRIKELPRMLRLRLCDHTKEPSGSVMFVRMHQMSVSSSKIKMAYKNQSAQDNRHHLPSPVFSYIQRNRIYATD